MAQYNELEAADGIPGEHRDQYLTFFLADEDYGVDILRVQEIRGWETVTRIPNAPVYVKGVLNLRGAIVPVLDLRQRFGMSVQEYHKDTVVIVLRVSGEMGMRNMGVVVDAVSDVLNASAADIRDTPNFGAGVATEYISGLVSADNSMIMLLDVDRMLNEDIEADTGAEEAA